MSFSPAFFLPFNGITAWSCNDLVPNLLINVRFTRLPIVGYKPFPGSTQGTQGEGNVQTYDTN